MDADIQFGELEEAEPESHLRPDRNKHFAVVAYQSPDDDDLPIFVDLDVMRDVEYHALEDTQVELGGVLLGGQFEDEQGRPFVLITDSLRAQHYEATKGSFKFTHDTWEDISRQREQFPDDLQMVGWYHTHPDWGVFLSTMDMFICDNFFNRPMDLALVIDPCRPDRGMYQWTGDPTHRIRRTGGFYLVASRFRQFELEQFTLQLEGKYTMANDPRSSGLAGPYGPLPAPVVNIAESRNSWQGVAVMGMLTMQFLMLSLIAWKLVVVPAAQESDRQARQVATIEEKLDDLIVADKKNAAYETVVDGIITQLNGGDTLAKKFEDLKKAQLDASIQVNESRALSDQRGQMIVLLDSQLQDERQQSERLSDELEKAGGRIKDRDAMIKRLEKKLAGYTAKDGDPSTHWTLVWIGGGVAVILVITGIVAVVTLRNESQDGETENSDNSRKRANSTED